MCPHRSFGYLNERSSIFFWGINLCDIPDVVVVAFPDYVKGQVTKAEIYMLDGATGTLHFRTVGGLPCKDITPALGDIDNDGLPERERER